MLCREMLEASNVPGLDKSSRLVEYERVESEEKDLELEGLEEVGRCLGCVYEEMQVFRE